MQNWISNKSDWFWKCSVDKNVWYLISRRLQDDNSKLFRNQVQTMHTMTYLKNVQFLQGWICSSLVPDSILFYVQTITCLHFLHDDDTMRNNFFFHVYNQGFQFSKMIQQTTNMYMVFFNDSGIYKIPGSAYVYIDSVLQCLCWKCAAKRRRPLHSQFISQSTASALNYHSVKYFFKHWNVKHLWESNTMFFPKALCLKYVIHI